MNNDNKKICNKCGYEYQAEKDKWFAKCPNCGIEELRDNIDPVLNMTIYQEDDGYPD